MGFLLFALKFIHVLAWPLLALGYPLYASIQAVETNSNHNMRNLIAYWILFSFISLFELAFANLIQWVAVWPYIKLVIVCCLTLPQFTGAYHAYQSLVHPWLHVNIEEVINRLRKPKQAADRTENFLTMVEKYVKENGTEALENFICGKGSKGNFDVKEIKTIASMEGKGLAPKIQNITDFAQNNLKAAQPTAKTTASPAKWVEKKTIAAVEEKGMTLPPLQLEKKIIAAVEEKGMMMPPLQMDKNTASGEEALWGKALPLKVQKEWTCAVCQVKTSSKINLNDHLQGRKHKAKYEELKAQAIADKQTTKLEAYSSSIPEKPSRINQEQVFQVKLDIEKCRQTANESGLNQHKTKKEQIKPQENWRVKGTGEPGIQSYKNWCYLCGLSCTCEANMRSHLGQKKHLSRFQEIPTIKPGCPQWPNYGDSWVFHS